MKIKLSNHSEDGAFRGPFEATFTALGAMCIVIALLIGLPVMLLGGTQRIFYTAGALGVALIIIRIILLILQRIGKW